jgi:hypothetical protein
MAKVEAQDIEAQEVLYWIDGYPVYWGQQVRDVLGSSAGSNPNYPAQTIATASSAGPRPTTRTHVVGGLWYDYLLNPVPFNPHTIPDINLWNNPTNQTSSRAQFLRAVDRWKALTPAAKACYCQMAREAGDKCSCLDFFIKRQLMAFKTSGYWDAVTCKALCLAYNNCETTLTFSPGGIVTSWDPDNPKAFLWELDTLVTVSASGDFVPGSTIDIWPSTECSDRLIVNLPCTFKVEHDLLITVACIE